MADSIEILAGQVWTHRWANGRRLLVKEVKPLEVLVEVLPPSDGGAFWYVSDALRRYYEPASEGSETPRG